MGLFKKKPDPISERERAIAAKIATLEAQIKQLSGKLEEPPSPGGPRLRSTARPHGAAAPANPGTASSSTPSVEPIFETVDQNRLKSGPGTNGADEHYNELGVRKYDLAGAFQRMKNTLRGPSPSNPKLVNLLAAGSVQGLQPLRYEKRTARNRFIFVTVVLLVVLIGLFAWIRHH